eukprot:gene31086-38419_t
MAFQYDFKALEESAQSLELHEAVRTTFELSWVHLMPMANIFIHIPFGTLLRYKTAMMKVKAFCWVILAHLKELQRKGELHKEGFGHALMEFAKLDGVTDEDLQSEILTMFVAGHETTAHTKSWFIYALSTHPEIQTKCQEAIDAQSDEDRRANHLPTYVEAVLKESMRKYPAAIRGSMRFVTHPGGFTIPATVLNKSDPNIPQSAAHSKVYTKDIHFPEKVWFINYYATMHTSKSNWGDKAMDFIPERWLPGGNYLGTSSNPNEVNPLASAAIYGGGGTTGDDLSFANFSYGVRNCIGMNLAMMELRVTIGDLLRQFSFQLADEEMRDESEWRLCARKVEVKRIDLSWTVEPVRRLVRHLQNKTILAADQLPSWSSVEQVLGSQPL